MNKLIGFLAVVFVIAFPLLAQAEEEEKTISGTVTDTDWVSFSLTVRYFEARTGRQDEITVRVPHEARLNRGTRSMSFSDIRQSDNVVVTYYSDDLSGFKAKRVSDLNQGNR